MITLQGDKLIFLISQPRSGSTLTQRILANHPAIHTVAEPWLMLSPFYALRKHGYEAQYNANWGQIAVKNFLNGLQYGNEDYTEGVRRMYAYLYNSALASSGKKFFLDKTPRYYNIIPELKQTFPDANFIILLRNPLAVLCSIINICQQDGWLKFYLYRRDLLDAPRLLLNGIELLKTQSIVLHYEQLLANPKEEITRICNALGVDSHPDLIHYGSYEARSWILGDQHTVHQKNVPDSEYAEKWIKNLKSPQVWRLSYNYLQVLGEEVFNRLGYPYKEMMTILESYRPTRFRLWKTFPLGAVVGDAKEFRKWNYQYYILKWLQNLRVQTWG